MANNGTDRHLELNRQIHLSSVEEHYLKKALIKNQIISELNSLSPDYNDTSGLRRFGPPFVPADPQWLLKNPDSGTVKQIYSISESSIDIFRSQFPFLRFIFENYFITFPFIKIHLNKLGSTFREQSKFWLKIQVLFELFKSKKISNSNDRGSTSKRKLLLYKIQGLFLTFFNSSIYCKQDPEYFQMDKERRGAYKKLGKFIDAAESEKMNQNNNQSTDIDIKELEDEFLNMNLSSNNLMNHLNNIEENEYINGYYINVIGVTVESETKNSFWVAKESKYYAFIIQVKVPTEKSWFIKRRYSDFEKLYKDLKHSFPGAHIAELPSKDKNFVQLNNEETPESFDKVKDEEIIDYKQFDESFNHLDENKFNELFEAPETPPISEPEAKTPKSPFTGFAKPSFLKSPMLSPRKNKSVNRLEKSFLNSFKGPSSSSSSTASSAASLLSSPKLQVPSEPKRSISSPRSSMSADSIDSSDSSDTFHSVNTNNGGTSTDKVLNAAPDRVVFPREILRQSLRGFLKFVLYNKKCCTSTELKTFLTKTPIELTSKDIESIQQRINLDNLRTLQHYKFQSVLVEIVKVLEKDVEVFKTEIYNGGFSYIFDRIKTHETLHELCGYESNIESGLWLKNLSAESGSQEASPLRGFVRVILLEIASTQYELLIGSDSSNGTLKTIKSLHSVFPYRLIAGVLRFTNPLMMVKRMIDIFTYQMPNVTGGVTDSVNAIGNGIGGVIQGLGLAKWGTSEKEVPETSKKTNNGGRSLLQLIFSSMLGEDLRKSEKESVEIRDLLVSFNSSHGNEYGEGEIIMERIDKYFKSSDEIVLHIKDMSLKLGLDLPTTIMMPNNGLKDVDELGANTVNEILKGFSEFKRREVKEVTKKEGDEENEPTSKEESTLYRLTKRYFYLQLRIYDKESLIELWNEPELMNVIKEVISIFLTPLIELFKKAEVYKYIPIFAKYMGELIELCEVYSNDYGQFGRSDIVGALVGLEEKYSEHVYKFVRDLYLNDLNGEEEDKLFEGIVEWLNGVVKFLRFVKKERIDLMIDLNKLLRDIDLTKEEKLEILKNINKVVKVANKKRQLLEKMEETGELKKNKEKEERSKDWTKMERDRKVDGKWDEIHNRVFKVGELIAGGDEDGGDIYDMVEIEEETDEEEEQEEEEGEEEGEGGDNDKVEKTEKSFHRLQDADFDVQIFMESYYSRDWGVLGGTNMLDQEYDSRVAKAFKTCVGNVFAEYGRSQAV